MSFHVGQKVVCVDDSFHPGWWVVSNRPVKQGIYTVRAFATFDFGPSNINTPCILLEEIINPVERWTGGETSECPFWIGRFRPIVERKTSISIFTAMLNPSKVDA